MALNRSPKVLAAKKFAEQFDQNQVIIIHLDDMTMGFASYGKTEKLCADAKKLGNVAYDAIYECFNGG